MNKTASVAQEPGQTDSEAQGKPDTPPEKRPALVSHPKLQRVNVRQSAVDGQRSNWQTILWRAWRDAEDEEYAQHLFNLVADEPVGWKTRLAMIGLGAIFGAIAGGFLDVLIFSTGLRLWLWAGAIAGAGVSAWLSRNLSMRRWLAILTPNSYFSQLLAPFKIFLVLILIGLIYLVPTMWLSGLVMGFGSGLLLGLVLGLISWPFLGLIGLFFSQAALLAPSDLLLSWASVGVGLGFGVMLAAKSSHKHEFTFRHLCFWWTPPPLNFEVEAALRQAVQTRRGPAVQWKKALERLENGPNPETTPKSYLDKLAQGNWQDRFVARQMLVTLGGEAVDVLRTTARDKNSPVRATALSLLQSIEQDTNFRLTQHLTRPACTRCMARCQEYLVSISAEDSITYYGCRICRQSRNMAGGELVAVLDVDMEEAWVARNTEQVRVNWLQRRTLFDFDRVEITNASDEDVERFAVQVGNDTEQVRQPSYRQLPCHVAPDCRLLENTRRILRRTFGQVEEG